MSRFLWVVTILALSGCIGFSISRGGGIVRFNNGEAYTAFGRFVTGRLPSSWKGPDLQLKQLVYKNDSIGATILIDSLCGPKFVDAPLPRLVRDLFDRMEGQKLGRERSIVLDGRAAHRLSGSGRVDGVLLQMDVVVMKKDFCLYDFVYFAPPGRSSQGLKDFEELIHGFKTR